MNKEKREMIVVVHPSRRDRSHPLSPMQVNREYIPTTKLRSPTSLAAKTDEADAIPTGAFGSCVTKSMVSAKTATMKAQAESALAPIAHPVYRC